VLPLEPVLAAGLSVDAVLDRGRARQLGRELRRARARRAALAALDRADHTESGLRARLAARGVAPAEREETVAVLARAGLVDDARFARERAAALAARGSGDALIRDDLERRGVPAELVEEALAGVDAEPERALRLARAEGATPRLLRRLAARGFDEASLETLIADLPGAELG
jgi:SOS response regulatory protein OraA/RecX